jgi:inosose dehydratase
MQTTGLTRREFIRQTGCATLLGACSSAPLAALAASPEPAPKILVGSQLYGWGQYYQRMKKDLNANLDEVLSALRDCGYDYAEGNLDAGNPENNLRFAAQLKAHGLKPVCLYTGSWLHEEGKAQQNVERLVKAAPSCREAGFRVINCNADPIGREKTDQELAVQVRALKELGQGLKDFGLKLGIHHHTPEMVNKAREFHYVFRNTPPELVGFCFDVHWVYRGGLDPMAALQEYHGRVVSWHLRQSRNGVWWEDLDTGDIDYAAIAAYVRAHAVPPIYSVEMALEGATKITRSAVENHQRCCAFVRRVFGG